jgi:hypothetical protein
MECGVDGGPLRLTEVVLNSFLTGLSRKELIMPFRSGCTRKQLKVFGSHGPRSWFWQVIKRWASLAALPRLVSGPGKPGKRWQCRYRAGRNANRARRYGGGWAAKREGWRLPRYD